MAATALLAADIAWPLWDEDGIEGAFEFQESNIEIEKLVASKVNRPWLFGYRPEKPNGRGVLILGGGGYTQLMVGKEGVVVARWLASLGFFAAVLVHRFPTSTSGPQAPLDDARQALRLIDRSGFVHAGLGICGLSSGGHLGASLLAEYPKTWTEKNTEPLPKLTFAIIGYGPISTNAKGRTIVPNKAPLEPPEKQTFYDIVQPDVQLAAQVPPTFIVYSGNDPIVPVVNAYRLAEGIMKANAEVELHVYADAPHGFALDTVDLPVSKWPVACEAWLAQNNLV